MPPGMVNGVFWCLSTTLIVISVVDGVVHQCGDRCFVMCGGCDWFSCDCGLLPIVFLWVSYGVSYWCVFFVWCVG